MVGGAVGDKRLSSAVTDDTRFNLSETKRHILHAENSNNTTTTTTSNNVNSFPR